MKLYFVRHGESEANVLRVFSNRGIKHPLTPKGREQAEALSEELQNVDITRVYSSPLLRAQQTTEILLKKLKCPAQIADPIREADAGLEDRSDDTSWFLHFEVMQQWLSNLNLDRRINDGENFYDLKQRFVPFIDSLLEKDENALLVGHGGIFGLMFPVIFENIDNNFILNKYLPNCCLITAEKFEDRLFCTNWCGENYPR